MKISKGTLEILKNYSVINPGIVIDEPNYIKTMSPTEGIIAIYKCDETFPVFALWDLQKFNQLIDVLKIENCDFEFDEDDQSVLITSNSRKIAYEYAEIGSMPVFEQMKESSVYEVFDQFDFSFNITADEISEIKKINSIFGFSEDLLKIEMKDGEGKLKIYSENNESVSNFEMNITGEGTGEAVTKVSDMIMINSDYKASVCDKMIKYQSTDRNLMYFIRTYLTNR